jgi:hypothetical protein
VEDEVGGSDHCPISRRRYSRIGVAVERICVKRAIISYFGTKLDLRREPVLPAQRYIGVIGHDSGPLSLGVHKKFGPEREVVQLVWRVIYVEKKRLLAVQVSATALPQCAAFGALNGMICGLQGVPPLAMAAAATGLSRFGTPSS